MKFSIIFLFLISAMRSFHAQESSDLNTMKELESKIVSENADDRRDAALILGKFINAKSNMLLVNALKDKNKLVRRAALVSLQDRIMKRMLEENYYTTLFETINDEDAEVRRISTGTLPFYLPIYLMKQSDYGEVQINTKNFQRQCLDAVVERLSDTDKGVRKNILTVLLQARHLFFQSKYLQKIKLALLDEEDENSILALSFFKNAGYELKQELLSLASRNKPTVSMAILNYMSSGGKPEKEVLDILVKSNDLEVKVDTIIFDINSGLKNYTDELISFLQNETNPNSLRIKLIQPLRYIDKSKLDVIKLLNGDTSIDIKTEIYKQIENFISVEDSIKTIKKQLGSENPISLQKVLIQKLLQFNQNITSKELASYFENRNVEIRKMILMHANQNKLPVKEILFESLLDDQESIRLLALEIISRSVSIDDEILEMLVQFLEDPSIQIQEKSYIILANKNDEKKLYHNLEKLFKTKNKNTKKYICELIQNYSNPGALNLIKQYANDQDQEIKLKANFILYKKDANLYAPALSNLVIDETMPASSRLSAVRVLFNRPDLLATHAEKIAHDQNLDLRWNFLKLFINKKGYLKEPLLFNRLKVESSPLCLETIMYLIEQEGFHSPQLVEYMVKSENKRIKIRGVNILNIHYNENLTPAFEIILNSDNINDNLSASYIIIGHSLKNYDEKLVEITKKNITSVYAGKFLFCLLKLNTQKCLDYVKTIKDDPKLKKIYDQALFEFNSEQIQKVK